MGKGLTITRYFTKEGINVKELFQWTQRDVQLLNDKGAVLFSDTVEAPDFWSDTAVQIAASKYFCIDSKGTRENSIFQMICRVVDKITEFANEQNYFDSKDSSEIFSEELKYIFIDQMASVNSPVWFNFGAHGHQQMASACYILGVEDNMESIMKAVTDESMIFKHGSGVGMNLSELRSSGESLSSSGKASGPVSFMYGYDAMAGIVKSGGVTRRAAVMIELDADHPDIIEFINSKANEEYKAHLFLEIAGISQLVKGVDTDLLERIIAKSVANDVNSPETLSILEKLKNNELISEYLNEFIGKHNWSGFSDNTAYSTVGLQNMNISVSIPDSFMRKVTGKDSDPTWYLFGRKSVEFPKFTKSVKKECAQGVIHVIGNTSYICVGKNDYRIVYGHENASTLLMLISESVQKCGDPGVQFIDKINEWFMARNSDTVRGSNPCSEVFLPNNTSCNLASLRLTKFLTKNYNFDISAFKHVIRTLFIAQDAVINLSVYPTTEVKDNTIKYRAIGMGVADAGALLMQLGLPYDSDEGRNCIAAIMSLMTATGYSVSNELANFIGKSDIYEENQQNIYVIFDKHRAENTKLLSKIGNRHMASNIANEAAILWDYMTKPNIAIRNMAATALAPTGTISLIMDCQTTGIEPDFSLIKYKRLAGGGVMQFVNNSVVEALRVLGYSPEDREYLEQYARDNGHLENTCLLKDDDLPVFDCAGKAQTGTRLISPKGHIDMMSAVQPFISMGISKCVTGDTLIQTDKGFKRIDSWYNNEAPDTFKPLVIDVESNGKDKHENTDQYYYGGKQKVLKITLNDGRTITGTPNHPLWASKEANSSELTWVELQNLEIGDFVTYELGRNKWTEKLVTTETFIASPKRCSQKTVIIPKKITDDLGYLLGCYSSEGSRAQSTWTITITNNNPVVLQHCGQLFSQLFGVQAKYATDKRNGVTSVNISSKEIFEFFTWCGADGTSGTKVIPWVILQSPKSVVSAYIGGLWLDGFTRKRGDYTAICLKSHVLIQQLKVLFDNYGIRSNIITKTTKDYGKFYELGIYGRKELKQFINTFTLEDVHKKTQIENYLVTETSDMDRFSSDIVPTCLRKYIEDLGRKRNHMQTPWWKAAHRKEIANLSWKYANIAFENMSNNGLYPNGLGTTHFLKITKIEEDEAEVFDISVPVSHSFLANGIISHNTVNISENSTANDIYSAYIYSWEKGVKAIALYRDNSKRIQPLTSKLGSTTTSTFNTEYWKKRADELGIQGERKKMSDNCPTIRHKFSIGGHEGYLHCGMYDNGKLGEIFVRISKEGSTISGVIDAFATMFSIALQRGTPLDTLVQKFAFQRFEPSGWTKCRNIPKAESVIDYIVRWLAFQFLSREEAESIGVQFFDDEDETRDKVIGRSVNVTEVKNTELLTTGLKECTEPKLIKSLALESDAPTCNSCGARMQRAGKCYTCLACGNSNGCG